MWLTGLGQHGVVFELTLSEGGRIPSNDDELGFTRRTSILRLDKAIVHNIPRSKSLQGRLVA